MNEFTSAAAAAGNGIEGPGPIRIGVLGAKGRMGAEVCRAAEQAEGVELVAQVDLGDPLTMLTDARVDVALDFTHPDAVMDNIRWCVDAGIHCVVGTDVLPESKFDVIRSWLADKPTLGVLIAPIFSIGAVVALRLAEIAAKHFESAEIIELHHPTKADAPASPAVHLAKTISTVRAEAGMGPVPDATTVAMDGARGVVVDGVHVHAVRVRGLLGHLEVILGSAGETLTLRHDQLHRECFTPGVLLAVRSIRDRPGLTLGLAPLLDL